MEMEFTLSQAVASGDAFEHRPSECGHCVQDVSAELDLRDLPGSVQQRCSYGKTYRTFEEVSLVAQ